MKRACTCFLALLAVAACGGGHRLAGRSAAPSDHGARASSASESTSAAPSSPTSERPAEGDVIEVEPMRVEVVTDADGEEEIVAYDARLLFDEGNEALAEGRYDEALRRYGRLVADFPDSRLVPPALYNAGLALEGKGDPGAAVARYRAVAERAPGTRDAVDALIRAGAVLAELERWTEARELFERLLERDGLTASDRIEVMARRGYVLLEAKDYPAAETQLSEALAYYEQAGAEVHLETDYFVAMSRYYLGEIPRRQFQAIPIRLPEAQLQKDVERKAELVLLAAQRYGEAIRTGNIYWATAAGHRLASMQKEFWDALVLAPIPPHLSAQEAEIYVGEIRKLALRHLEKALSIHRQSVELAEAYKAATPWSEASRREVVRLTELIARERAGEKVTPSRPGEGSVDPEVWFRAPETYVPGRIDL